MNTDDTLLRITGLSKRFGTRRLLEIPELTLRASSCTLLQGCNGAGKTTLMKILAGLEPPDRAEVELDGRRLGWQAARPLCRGRVVYVHQQPYLLDRSVADNVAYGLQLAGWSRSRITAEVRQALAWAGLDHLADRNARTLSGGEKQRVTFTRARVLRPALLLLDEPTANLDQEARGQTHALVRRLRAEGLGILISSHEVQAVAPLADRILTLAAGHLQEETPLRAHSHLSLPDPLPWPQVGEAFT